MTDVLDRHYFFRSGSDDVNQLEAGDVILFEVLENSTNLVAKMQGIAGYEPPAANISHSAIYIGNGCLCHAVPLMWHKPRGGIVIERVWDKVSVGTRRIYVLRGADIPLDKRKDIALYAASKSVSDFVYDWSGIFDNLYFYAEEKRLQKTEQAKLFLKKFTRGLGQAGATAIPAREAVEAGGDGVQVTVISTAPEKDDIGLNHDIGGAAGFICSDLVAHCYNIVLGRDSPFARGNVTRFPVVAPADIYLNSALSSVKSKSETDRVHDLNQIVQKHIGG